jgi:hypothetical protein
MTRRISVTIPDDVERIVLARMEAQGVSTEKEGAFSGALIAYIREFEVRIEGYKLTIASLERVAASGSAPASPAPKAQEPAGDWGADKW